MSGVRGRESTPTVMGPNKPPAEKRGKLPGAGSVNIMSPTNPPAGNKKDLPGRGRAQVIKGPAAPPARTDGHA